MCLVGWFMKEDDEKMCFHLLKLERKEQWGVWMLCFGNWRG